MERCWSYAGPVLLFSLGLKLCLSVATKIKIRLFQTLVLSMLLCAFETWTPCVADMKTLEAFYLKCLRQILGVRWHQRITNLEILFHAELIAYRHTAAFGHIARLADNVPAHLALHCQIDTSLSRLSRNTWKHRPCCPRNRWLDLARQDSDCSAADLRRRAVLHGRGTRTMLWLSPAMQGCCWWWWWCALQPVADIQCIKWDAVTNWVSPEV